MKGLVTGVFLFVVLSLAVPVRAGFQEGVDAYECGDYAMALKELRPLAEQGNATAQYNLAVMYDNGQGVPQNFNEAAKWYRKAAEQGEAKAQYNLAVMYAKGQGVPWNDIVAYALCNVAAAGNSSERVKISQIRDLLTKLMTPSQIEAAQALSLELAKPGNFGLALDAYLGKAKRPKKR